MPFDRRRFVQFAAAAASALGAAPAWALGPTLTRPPARPLRILVLGGTRYLGPAVVRAALTRGHQVTLFNRGKTRPWLFPGVRQLRGDRFPERDGGLTALEEGRWDVAIDMCAYYPRLVEASTKLLASRVDHYVMISSISVYSDLKSPGVGEDAPKRVLNGPFQELADLTENDWPTYGARKAAGEAIIARAWGDRAAFLRPTSICGGENNDGTGAYWAARVHSGGKILLPGDGSDPVQLIDVGDVADFAVLAAERRLSGAYNLVGPAQSIDVRGYMASVSSVVGRAAELVWKGDFPQEMSSLPMIAPYRRVPGFATMRNERARQAGLAFRPLEETLRANWVDHRSRRGDEFEFAAAGIGLTAAKEAELLTQVVAA